MQELCHSLMSKLLFIDGKGVFPIGTSRLRGVPRLLSYGPGIRTVILGIFAGLALKRSKAFQRF